jgi:hypothetical protein
MKEKVLILIGLNSKKWLSEQLGINPLTLETRLEKWNWKASEEMAIDLIFDREKHRI